MRKREGARRQSWVAEVEVEVGSMARLPSAVLGLYVWGVRAVLTGVPGLRLWGPGAQPRPWGRVVAMAAQVE